MVESSVLAVLLLSCVDYGVTRNTERESWTQPAREGGVDILWVVDDSQSMYEEQQQLAEHSGNFIELLLNIPVDFRLAVTTTDMEEGGGALVGEILTGETEELREAFIAQATDLDNGSRDERGFDAAIFASDPSTSDFARTASDLEVVFFTDEDDQSDMDVETFAEELRSQRNGGVFVNGIIGDLPEGCASLIAAADPGFKYVDAQSETGGTRESICSDDYGAMLERVAYHVLGLNNVYALAAVPEPASLEVRVDNVIIPERDRHGWSYDPGENVVILDGFGVPRPGSDVVIRYFEWFGADEDTG